MKKITALLLFLTLFSCATKKHKKCDAYGNKLGDINFINLT